MFPLNLERDRPSHYNMIKLILSATTILIMWISSSSLWGSSYEEFIPMPHDSSESKQMLHEKYRFTEPYYSDRMEMNIFSHLLRQHMKKLLSVLEKKDDINENYILPAASPNTITLYYPGKSPSPPVQTNFYPVKPYGGVLIGTKGGGWYDVALYLVVDDSFPPLNSTTKSYERRRSWETPRIKAFKNHLRKLLNLPNHTKYEEELRKKFDQMNKRIKKIEAPKNKQTN